MKSRKIITITVVYSLLLGTFTPMLEAAENNRNNIQIDNTDLYEKLPKEAHSYDEFTNAKEPVVIDPNLLTVAQLRQHGVSENDIREIQSNKSVTEYRAPQYGKVYGKKKRSHNYTKYQISNALKGVGGILVGLSRLVKHPVISASGPILGGLSSLNKNKRYKGIKIGGIAYKKLYRKGYYTTPKLTWLYHATWMKKY